MGRRAFILTAIGLLGGCAAREPAAVMVHDALLPRPPSSTGPPPNLVLGPTAEVARLGEWFAYRSDWPASENGVRLEELSTYLDATYDDQAYYDRFGGAFFKVQNSIRAGVVVR